MPSNYPNQIDAFTNPGVSDNLDTPGVLHTDQHANANDAIEAIETELGIQPSGAQATVADRLTAIDQNFGTFTIDGGTF